MRNQKETTLKCWVAESSESASGDGFAIRRLGLQCRQENFGAVRLRRKSGMAAMKTFQKCCGDCGESWAPKWRLRKSEGLGMNSGWQRVLLHREALNGVILSTASWLSYVEFDAQRQYKRMCRMRKQPRETGLIWKSVTSVGNAGGKVKQRVVLRQVIEILNVQTTNEWQLWQTYCRNILNFSIDQSL